MTDQPQDFGENLSQKYRSRYWTLFKFKFFQIPEMTEHNLSKLISDDKNAWDEFLAVMFSTKLQSALIREVKGLLHKKFLYDPEKAESVAKELIDETWSVYYYKLISVEMKAKSFLEITADDGLQKIFNESFKVVVNRCISRPAKKQRDYTFVNFEDWENTNLLVAEDPFNQIEINERYMELSAKCGFSKIEQTVVWLRLYVKYKNPEVVGMLNMPLEKIQDIFYNAMKKARKKRDQINS